MGLGNWLQNAGVIGQTSINMFDDTKNNLYATPEGQNAIATSTLTKAQKTFSSSATNPNLPKPKTLFFVHFNLNADLENKIQYKNKFIQQVSGTTFDTVDPTNEVMDIGHGFSSAWEGIKSTVTTTVGTAIGHGWLWGKDDKKADKDNQADRLSIEGGAKERTTVVDYIPTRDVLKKLAFEMSKIVSAYNKPSVTFKTTELNEYNRKRIVYSGVDYNEVTISFYDVKNNPVQQFFNAYLKFICGDFFCKDKYLWEKPIDNNHWQNVSGYKTIDGDTVNGTYLGNLNSFGLNIDSNFKLIDSISFCEYYMDRLTVYTIENPIITKIDWGDAKTGDFGYNEIKVTFKYEGITNDLIDVEPYNVDKWDSVNKMPYVRYMVNREIKNQVATFMQTRYETLSSNLITDAVSIMKGYVTGDKKFSWSSLKNQLADTGRKYGFANEVNTALKVENTINRYNSKEGKEKNKYLINVATDPTSVVGKITKPLNDLAGFNNNILL